ncbi:hypothetical protein [Saccharopolyspora griseoalba]|uniref:Uncharacterized protein n=1 Tax=Saccharopolyspora griseoalba TaxID=1431848 RepID=A0ABW2LPW9_9PSEU
MGLLSKPPATVYLVEDHTEPGQNLRYWAHVYLSLERAKADVETYAQRGGHGPVRWSDRLPAYAFPDTDKRAAELYRVIPLPVWTDDKVLP